MRRITKLRLLKFAETAADFMRRRKLRQLCFFICSAFVVGLAVIYTVQGAAQMPSPSACTRPTEGSVVTNPPEIKNPTASNPANFTAINSLTAGQSCYLADGNLQAPTLRVTPKGGKKAELVLKLTNKLSDQGQVITQQNCVGGMAPPNSTNLHYHGLNGSPACYQDEVVKTVIKPNESFNFSLQLPKKEPPGLYWYHPHVHMQSEGQVLSGLTGAIIVEGIGKFNKQAAKLPERVFVLRDMEVSVSDGNAPGKDISINSVPIIYKGNNLYGPPAIIKTKPNEQQFWRMANTAADTYFNLQVIYDGIPQQLGLVAMDGVPINTNGQPKDQTIPVTHILLPPGGRAEFIITGPGSSVKDASLLTLKYDRGQVGDNDPLRTIAKIDTQAQLTALTATSTSAAAASTSNAESIVDTTQVSGDLFSGLSQINPVQQRTLYFSQNDALGEFYITVQGNKPKVYNPNFTTPDITVQEGTTEDWTVENQALEAHAFHIHQIHFLVLDSLDQSEIGMVRDTINLPAWNPDPNKPDLNKTPYPKVKLRMDFLGASKDTSIAGTFVYHCHILEHEDKGMMAPIEVKSL